MTGFEDDLAAAADLGFGPDALDKMAASGMTPGAFATFRSLDAETRSLVLRLLDSPDDAAFRELAELPHGSALARWLLTLPAYANATYDDEDE